jgi:Ankyrin repeats (3 copies)/SET domain
MTIIVNTEEHADRQRFIFSKSEWESMYPREKYVSRTKNAMKHVLHWLLALGQSDKNILSYITKKLKEKKVTVLFVVDEKNYHFTPLMIATMRGRYKVVQAILGACNQRKAHLALKDSYKWTALHHAAISSNEIYELLKASGASIHAYNAAGGTPNNLLNLVNEQLSIFAPSQVRIICQDKIVRGVDNVLKSNLLKEEMGLTVYRDIPYYQPDAMKTLWEQNPETDNSCFAQTIMVKAWQKYIKGRPNLLIKNSEELAHVSERTLGLFADTDIPSGDIITIYSGAVKGVKNLPNSFKEHFNSEFSKEIYLLDYTNATDYGNASRYANWGWPNATIQNFYVDGALHHALVASEPDGITAGEEIYWDYGIYCIDLAFGKQKILGREKMREFFSCGLQQCFHKVSGFSSPVVSITDLMGRIIVMQRVMFPLNSPTALLDLHFNGLVGADEWYEAVLHARENPVTDGWERHNRNIMTYMRSFLKRIIAVEDSTKGNIQIHSLLKNWVLDNIGELSVMQILKGFDILKERIKDGTNYSEGDWLIFFNGLVAELKDYDWVTDDQAPMHIHKVREDALTLIMSLPKFEAIINIEIGLKFVQESDSDLEDSDSYSILMWIKNSYYQHLGYKNGELPPFLKRQIEQQMKLR